MWQGTVPWRGPWWTQVPEGLIRRLVCSILQANRVMAMSQLQADTMAALSSRWNHPVIETFIIPTP